MDDKDNNDNPVFQRFGSDAKTFQTRLEELFGKRKPSQSNHSRKSSTIKDIVPAFYSFYNDTFRAFNLSNQVLGMWVPKTTQKAVSQWIVLSNGTIVVAFDTCLELIPTHTANRQIVDLPPEIGKVFRLVEYPTDWVCVWSQTTDSAVAPDFCFHSENVFERTEVKTHNASTTIQASGGQLFMWDSKEKQMVEMVDGKGNTVSFLAQPDNPTPRCFQGNWCYFDVTGRLHVGNEIFDIKRHYIRNIPDAIMVRDNAHNPDLYPNDQIVTVIQREKNNKGIQLDEYHTVRSYASHQWYSCKNLDNLNLQFSFLAHDKILVSCPDKGKFGIWNRNDTPFNTSSTFELNQFGQVFPVPKPVSSVLIPLTPSNYSSPSAPSAMDLNIPAIPTISQWLQTLPENTTVKDIKFETKFEKVEIKTNVEEATSGTAEPVKPETQVETAPGATSGTLPVSIPSIPSYCVIC
jgi:hypothetical protein